MIRILEQISPKSVGHNQCAPVTVPKIVQHTILAIDCIKTSFGHISAASVPSRVTKATAHNHFFFNVVRWLMTLWAI